MPIWLFKPYLNVILSPYVRFQVSNTLGGRDLGFFVKKGPNLTKKGPILAKNRPKNNFPGGFSAIWACFRSIFSWKAQKRCQNCTRYRRNGRIGHLKSKKVKEKIFCGLFQKMFKKFHFFFLIDNMGQIPEKIIKIDILGAN